MGHGFSIGTTPGACGLTADGTGPNRNENQVGGLHCDLDCSGVRDADWDKHADHTPDTALGFVCTQCGTGTGPCGRQVHCAAAPARQAAWDLVTRDLVAPPFNLDSQSAFLLGNRIFYQGSGNIGAWHACTCGASSSGCGATNGYIQWLAADDDNGSLNDGTPHMTALFAAFDRHGIACAAPAPVNSGCAESTGRPRLERHRRRLLGDARLERGAGCASTGCCAARATRAVTSARPGSRRSPARPSPTRRSRRAFVRVQRGGAGRFAGLLQPGQQLRAGHSHGLDRPRLQRDVQPVVAGGDAG